MTHTVRLENHFMTGVLKAHARLEDVASRHAGVLETQVTKDFAKMDLLEKEKAEKIKDFATASLASQIWNPIAKVAQYVMSGASVIIGSSALLEGGWNMARMLLVSSGISGLAYRILEDTGLLNLITKQCCVSKEAQERVTRYLDIGNLCLSLGLGIAGGFWAHKTGTLLFLGAALKTQTFGSLILLGGKVVQGGIQFKVALIEKETARATALIQKIQCALSQLFQRMRENCKDAEHIMQTSGQVSESVQASISSLQTRSFS